MNSKTILRFIKIILLSGLIASSTGCSYISVPSDLISKNRSPSKFKLGIAVTPMDQYNRKPFRSEPKKLFEALKKTLEEKNKDSEQFININTLGEGEGFDYSQEFMNMDKRNILELQYSYQQVSVPLLLNLIGIFTLGILPVNQTFQFTVTPIVHSADGKSTVLTSFQSPTIDEWKSWLLFPFGYTESREIDYLQYVLSESINSSLDEIDEKRISVSTFKSNFRPLNLPFRMQMEATDCKERITYSNSSITAGLGKVICSVDVKFLNKSTGSISVQSRNFKIVVNGKEYSAMESIAVRNSDDVRSLSNGISVEPNGSDLVNRMNILFSIPREGDKPSMLKYIEKDISPVPIQIKFKSYK